MAQSYKCLNSDFIMRQDISKHSTNLCSILCDALFVMVKQNTNVCTSNTSVCTSNTNVCTSNTNVCTSNTNVS